MNKFQKQKLILISDKHIPEGTVLLNDTGGTYTRNYSRNLTFTGFVVK